MTSLSLDRPPALSLLPSPFPVYPTLGSLSLSLTSQGEVKGHIVPACLVLCHEGVLASLQGLYTVQDELRCVPARQSRDATVVSRHLAQF